MNEKWFLVVSKDSLLPPELKTSVTAASYREQRTQCMNSRTDPMLTISAPWRSSVKILLVASPEALFFALTSSLFGARVASACPVTAALLLRHCWTLGDSLIGAKTSSVFMIHSVYVWNFTMGVCACGAKKQKRLPGCADETDVSVETLQKWINLSRWFHKIISSINTDSSGFSALIKSSAFFAPWCLFLWVKIHTRVMECDSEHVCMNERLPSFNGDACRDTLRWAEGEQTQWSDLSWKCLFIQHGRNKLPKRQSNNS